MSTYDTIALVVGVLVIAVGASALLILERRRK